MSHARARRAVTTCQRRPGRLDDLVLPGTEMGGRTMAPHEFDHAPAGLVLSARGQGGFTIVTISGDIDLASVPVLREQLLAQLQPQASRIIIDLSGVTFCDASGLAVLVAASRLAGLLDGVVRLAALAPLTATVLRLTGLDSRFEIFVTVAEAIDTPLQPGVRDTGLPRSARLRWGDTLGQSRSAGPHAVNFKKRLRRTEA